MFILKMSQKGAITFPSTSTIMRARIILLLVSILVTPFLAQAAQPARTQLAPLRPDQSGVHTCGFLSLRDQEGSWDYVRLYPANYVRDAATKAGHQGFAANRPTGRGGV